MVQTALAEKSLSDYVRQAWPILEPTTPYLHNYHIDLISEHLEAVVLGQLTRLIVNIPPRYMKSILCSVTWPTWVWVKYPEKRFMFGSYAQGLSVKHSLDRRTIIESDWYQRRWGNRYRLRDDQNTKAEFVNDHRGHMIATSVDGTATGKGADILVVDDPVNPKEANSAAARENANTWFDRTFYTRLDNKRTGAIVVVMQRLHEQDLTGHLMAKEAGWHQLALPAEAPRKMVITLPISGQEITREKGDLLWPEREGPKELEDTRRNLGSYGFAGQYQQNPVPDGGGILKTWWWRYWQPKGANLPPVMVQTPEGEWLEIKPVDLPDQFDTELQSWDMAFKETSDSDYVAGGHWGQKGANSFLSRMLNQRLDFPKSVAAVDAWAKAYPRARPILIEDKANGPAVISTLQNKIGGIVAVNPEGGKEARAHAVSPFVEAGNVYLPHPMIDSLTDVLITQAAALPKGENDDLADQLTQALLKLQRGGVGYIPAADTATTEQLMGIDQQQMSPEVARQAPPSILMIRRQGQ